MAQISVLAVEYRHQVPEHSLNAPAFAVQLSDLRGRYGLGQAAPQRNAGLARLGGRIQLQPDAPLCGGRDRPEWPVSAGRPPSARARRAARAYGMSRFRAG